MTGLIVLTFIPFIVAIGFLIRVRAEQKARTAVEHELVQLQNRVQGYEQHMREVYPVLAHELRSPIAAILGYEELLGEGTFGPLVPRAREALDRIRVAAMQLSDLADGVDRLGRDAAAVEPAADVDATEIINLAMAAVDVEAQARDIVLTTDDRHVNLHTRRSEARRAVTLALGAAIKVSHGATLHITAVNGAVPSIRIGGTRLDAAVDSPVGASPRSAQSLSGAGLRLAFADAAARLTAGSIALEPTQTGADVRIDLPVVSD